MSMLPVGIGSAEAGGFQIERSLRFNSADSAYLNRTPASAGNRKTWTWSGWVKRSGFGVDTVNLFDAYASISNYAYFGFRYAATPGYETLEYFDSNSNYVTTTQVFRDPSAWYHLIIAFDTTQATAANRIKLYVNGTQVTAFSRTAYPTQNTDSPLNQAIGHDLGRWPLTPVYFNGYLTEINFIDGQALTPSSFGETDTDTGVWKPKKYTGSYGTNGFYLNFSDNSGTTSTTLGKDSSGNGNNWTPNNFSVTAGAGNDSLVDTPTPYGTDTGVGGEVRGNYCTWNPLDKNTNLNTVNGNLDVSASNGSWIAAGSTVALAGKIYAETTWTTAGNGFSAQFGLRQSDLANISAVNPTDTATAWSAYWDTAGTRATRTNSSITNNVGSAAVNDVYQVAFDADTGNLWLGYNNNWHGGGNPSTGTSPTYSGLTNAAGYRFFCATNYGTSTGAFVSNFGQRPFAYTPPAGFLSLCTTNLPTPTILDGTDYFNTVLYTGNGVTTNDGNTITGVGFQPDFVWLKNRTQATVHSLQDVVRGVRAVLQSQTTEGENSNRGYLNSFISDGFTTGNANGASIDPCNASGNNYVAWNWKANGAGSTNTAGTITSTVSVNTTSGFSIVTYTGTGSAATVGHGLGAVPAMIIVKSRSQARNWPVYHKNLTSANYYLRLDTTAAQALDANSFTTTPSSTVFSIGTEGDVNSSGATFVAYCFAPVAGYSAFGSYTGNGSADGPMIFTGFKPAFVMWKGSSTGTNWYIEDDLRAPYNPGNAVLRPNTSEAELSSGTGAIIDFLSNGFKIRNNGTEHNASGETYIYMAFAENPVKYSLAR